jgi:transposase-like protein
MYRSSIMAERTRYTAEFKSDAIALAEKIGVSQAAKDLGIAENRIYHWRKAAKEAAEQGIKAFPGNGNPRDEELARLRKENAELREVNEILKKAAVIFAKSPR